MTKLPKFLLRASLIAMLPVAANAAGTYYTGNYQSPQMRYNTQSYASRGYGANTTQTRNYNTTGYSAYSSTRPTVGTRTGQVNVARTNAQPTATTASGKNGFWLDAGISHENAMWHFEMKESSSKLHYDNVSWNVLDLRGGYVFDAGNTKMQIDAGFKYGMQYGDSSMVDDDITDGGYFVTRWVNEANEVIGDQIGHALSVGTSKGGDMYGFNAGFGLTDFFKWGNMRVTPSLGYRYFKYKLETKKNYGLSVDTAACFKIEGSDEIQCDPAIIVELSDGSQQVLWRDSVTGKMEIASNAKYIDSQGTYYYQQPGVSHSYEVEWSGPYLALDMNYLINANNSVNGRVELGLPGYKSVGDQPYRFDWAHPKSVEDKASIGKAMHFGFGANWVTAITNSVSLSLGLTYDYYTVSDADATTYLNGAYYTDLYNKVFEKWKTEHPGYATDADAEKAMLGQVAGTAGDETAISIKNLESQCSGWKCSASKEIDSFYKSMGIRVGVNARF